MRHAAPETGSGRGRQQATAHVPTWYLVDRSNQARDELRVHARQLGAKVGKQQQQAVQPRIDLLIRQAQLVRHCALQQK